MVCHNCDVSEGAFHSWVNIVREGFIKKNIISMSVTVCEEVGYHNATVDARSFLEKMMLIQRSKCMHHFPIIVCTLI